MIKLSWHLFLLTNTHYCQSATLPLTATQRSNRKLGNNYIIIISRLFPMRPALGTLVLAPLFLANANLNQPNNKYWIELNRLEVESEPQIRLHSSDLQGRTLTWGPDLKLPCLLSPVLAVHFARSASIGLVEPELLIIHTNMYHSNAMPMT